MAAEALQGQVTLTFAREGVRWALDADAEAVVQGAGGQAIPASVSSDSRCHKFDVIPAEAETLAVSAPAAARGRGCPSSCRKRVFDTTRHDAGMTLEKDEGQCIRSTV